MLTILLGLLSFTSVITLLVLVLLLARRVLVPTGRVAIHIDGTPERVLLVESGGNLLATLAAERSS